MANDKKNEQVNSVEKRLKSLYKLQTILSEIDRIKTIRGELPLEVKDLEDNIAGLDTRIANYTHEIAEFRDSLAAEQNKIANCEALIARYREQLDNIGFCFDWDREIRTCDPDYYQWTQWAFIEMFNHYYDIDADKAMPIADLEKHFEKYGSEGVNAAETKPLHFTAEEWKSMDDKTRSDTLMNYRIAYLGNTMVNWCPKLGTVLANDEVSEGVSVRGGYPVEQKLMYQWCLRVSAYAPRLLDDLAGVEWSDSIKETQRNWIGRSEGAEMQFKVKDSDVEMTIFTTRADTVFGVTFMVLAPESKYVDMVTTPAQKEAVAAYRDEIKHKTERERMIDKKVSGVFTGAYAINPLSGKEIPIYVSDYVLAGYGTGAIMAVPAHDSRDYAFARHFSLPVIPLIEGADVSEQSFDAKEGRMINSCGPELCLDGMEVKDAIARTKRFIEEKGIGRPSTYAPTLSTILQRGYVEREGKALKPTIVGETVTRLMKEQCGKIVDVKFTAEMEQELDEVEAGKTEWVGMMHHFYDDFTDMLQSAEKNMEGTKMKIPDEETDIVCELCGRKMVVRHGKYGKFLACPGFPECKNTKTLQQETPGSCPRCGKKVLAKKSKTGRTYYGCEDNPKCGFMTWDIPLAEKCPQCGSSLFKTTGRVKMIHCLKEGCGYEKSAK